MYKMAKYRKKPVVIEAEVYKPGLESGIEPYYYDENGPLCSAWKKAGYGLGPNGETFNEDGAVYVPFIKTLEGVYYITPGDYIITGVKGERYPCKPDIFEATYESVELQVDDDFGDVGVEKTESITPCG
jgi:hypothetical protein